MTAFGRPLWCRCGARRTVLVDLIGCLGNVRGVASAI
jgi:hypothetical protein